VLSHHVETHHPLRLLADNVGGVGYLLKDRVTDLAAFVEAVVTVGSGGSVIDPDVVGALLNRRQELTASRSSPPRELEVLALMAEGRTIRRSARACTRARRQSSRTSRASSTSSASSRPPDDHRRVLAVQAYLQSRPADG
jgi:DNA-binding NarL/FixJ family response regulator